MIYTAEQREKLVAAFKTYQKALKRQDEISKEIQEKLQQLKTASGLSTQGIQLIQEVKSVLGDFYLDDIRERQD